MASPFGSLQMVSKLGSLQMVSKPNFDTILSMWMKSHISSYDLWQFQEAIIVTFTGPSGR